MKKKKKRLGHHLGTLIEYFIVFIYDRSCFTWTVQLHVLCGRN